MRYQRLSHSPKYKNRNAQFRQDSPGSFIKTANESVSLLFSLVTKILLMGFFLVFTIWIIVDYRSNAYFFDKMTISPSLSELGYNEQFLATNLLESIEAISTEARSMSDYKEYINTSSAPEIKSEVMGIGLSLNEVVDITSQFFGHQRNHIRCQLIKTDYGLILYLGIKGQPIVKLSQQEKNLDMGLENLVDAAAIEVLKVTHPTTLAYYYYRRGAYEEAKATADIVLNKHEKDRKWAYNLIGKILNEQRKFDSAIAPLQKAVDLDHKFLSALNNLGIAFLNSSLPARDSIATIAFIKCVKADPLNTYKYSRYNLGRTWTRRGNYDSAIHYYKLSLKIDSAYLLALNNLGYVYTQMGKQNCGYYDTALSVLTSALKAPSGKPDDHARIWTTIGEAMLYKGDTTGFFNSIRTAVQHGYRFKKQDITIEPYIKFKENPEFLAIVRNKK